MSLDHPRRFAACVLVVCCAGSGCRPRSQATAQKGMPGPAPVMVDLVKNAAQTQQRLTREACTWTCTFELPDNTQVRLERTSTPKARRTILSTVAQGSAVAAFVRQVRTLAGA